MTRRIAAVLALLALAGPAQACGEGAVPCVLDGRALVDSVGVNTHFSEPATPYAARAGSLLGRLLEARIRHIRDVAMARNGGLSPDDGAALFRLLAGAGIRVDFLTQSGLKPGFLPAFAARVAPAAELFELPNERNDGTDPGWVDHLRADIRTAAASAGPIPLIGPALVVLSGDNPYALLGDQSARLAFGNMHPYSLFNPGTAGWGNPGAPPCQATRYGSIAFGLCQAAAASGSKPVMATEYGWSTDPRRHGAVPEAVQARYVVRGVLLQAMAGTARTYLYQLMDAGSDAGQFMGLLRADASPKPAFTALATLLDLADDTASGGPAPAIRLAGALDGVRSVLLRRRGGPSRLLAWVEAPAFDPDAAGGRGAPVAVAPRSVTLVLPPGVRLGAIRVIDDAGRAVPAGPGPGLVLTDRVSVVDLP